MRDIVLQAEFSASLHQKKANKSFMIMLNNITVLEIETCSNKGSQL